MLHAPRDRTGSPPLEYTGCSVVYCGVVVVVIIVVVIIAIVVAVVVIVVVLVLSWVVDAGCRYSSRSNECEKGSLGLHLPNQCLFL